MLIVRGIDNAGSVRREHGTHFLIVVGGQRTRLAVGQQLDVDLPKRRERTSAPDERQHPAVAGECRLSDRIGKIGQLRPAIGGNQPFRRTRPQPQPAGDRERCNRRRGPRPRSCRTSRRGALVVERSDQAA